MCIVITLSYVSESDVQTKIDRPKQKISSLDELLGVEPDTVDIPKIKSLASSALTFLMLGKKESYVHEISLLADACAVYLEIGHTVDDVMRAIKSSMAAQHEKALNKITSEIGMKQFQLNCSNPHTLATQNLNRQVQIMKSYLAVPLDNIIEGVITDTLVQASIQGAELGQFDFLNMKSL